MVTIIISSINICLRRANSKLPVRSFSLPWELVASASSSAAIIDKRGSIANEDYLQGFRVTLMPHRCSSRFSFTPSPWKSVVKGITSANARSFASVNGAGRNPRRTLEARLCFPFAPRRQSPQLVASPISREATKRRWGDGRGSLSAGEITGRELNDTQTRSTPDVVPLCRFVSSEAWGSFDRGKKRERDKRWYIVCIAGQCQGPAIIGLFMRKLASYLARESKVSA